MDPRTNGASPFEFGSERLDLVEGSEILRVGLEAWDGLADKTGIPEIPPPVPFPPRPALSRGRGSMNCRAPQSSLPWTPVLPKDR
jgi:hypothetical protein